MTSDSLGKSNEILVVGVHVGQLAVVEEENVFLAELLPLPNVCGDDALSLFLQTRVPRHLIV